MKSKTGVLLVNLGTPDSPKTKDVRSYLFQFLNDKRVIDLPLFIRWLLVNLIIVPFRAPKSSKIYYDLWSDKGSPIIFHTQNLAKKLQKKLGDEYHVDFAMRYKNPSLKKILKEWKLKKFKQIIILPLFPQYASATNGSVIELAMKEIQKWWVIPEITFVSQFFDHELFIQAFYENGSKYNCNDYDHILFSFHGLPERQVDKVYNNSLCAENDCELGISDNEDNLFCYKASCYETALRIAKKLNLNKSNFTVCFQSRLGRGWLEPFSDRVIENLAKEGKKKILIFSPAFVSDCLETIIEIGDEYQEIFEENGGEKVQLVESLNDNNTWVDCLKQIVIKRTI
tara:strand:- start:1334 stop:2356 length:1023 start_codon:yes stop_codon:yes gene_type:complete